MIPSSSGNFLKDFVQQFGLETESDEVKAQLFAKFNERVSGRVQERVYTILSPEERESFDTLLMNGDTGATERFVSAHGVDFMALVHEEAQKEMEITLGLMKVAA